MTWILACADGGLLCVPLALGAVAVIGAVCGVASHNHKDGEECDAEAE